MSIKNNSVLEHFKGLPFSEKQQLLSLLEGAFEESKGNDWLHGKRRETLALQGVTCPHCKSESVIKHGFKSGSQRYRCKACCKTFTEFKTTFVHCLKKKSKVREYLELFVEGKSIRTIRDTLKLSIQTVFDWRHKIIEALKAFEVKGFKGIVETDDVYFRLNRKNLKRKLSHWISWKKDQRGVSANAVSVQFTMDRYGALHTKKIRRGAINSKDLVYLGGMLDDSNVVCSDSSKAIIRAMKTMGVSHETFNSAKGYSRDRWIHVNTLNSKINAIRNWIKYCFSSVSTKYINNYLVYHTYKGKSFDII